MAGNNNWNPIYPTLPQKLHFRIGYFYSFGATQSNSSQSCNPRPRISSKQLFFARLARPIQQIFIRSIRSRGTEHPNSIERRSWNLVGHKWSSNISPGNWFVKFKAITPVVNFHEFFSCFLDTWMNSWMKFFFQHCVIPGVELVKQVLLLEPTWKLRQVGKSRTTIPTRGNKCVE